MKDNQLHNDTPPQWPLRLLMRFCPEAHHEMIEGDLLELYRERNNKNRTLNNIRYIYDALDLTWRSLSFEKIKTKPFNIAMLKNYLVVSMRHFLKNKSASLISIFSLVISLTFSLVIFNYVEIEKSYDSYIPDVEDKYRMIFDIYGSSGRNVHDAESPAPFAPFFAANIPAIKSYIRIFDQRNIILSNPGLQSTKIAFLGWTDPDILNFMGIEVISGSGKIEDQNSIMLSKSIAIRLFGSVSNAQGKTVRYNDVKNLEVQGIYEDFPFNSTVRLEAIGAIDVLQELIPTYYENGENWGGYSFHTYYKMNPNSDYRTIIESFKAKYEDRFDIDPENLPDEYFVFDLINVADIHLHSDMGSEMTAPVSITKLNLLNYLAIIIAIIGWINFINIQSARVPERIKEIGVRISLGANALNLRLMFLVEYLLICVFSSVIAIGIVYWSTTGFLYELLKIELPIFQLGLLATITLLIGTFSASFYPAIVASRLIKGDVIKTIKNRKTGRLRNFMISLQFAISLFLVVFTLTINQQVEYMHSLDPGFDTNSILVIDGPTTQSNDDLNKANQFRDELNGLASVDLATFSTLAPGKNKGWEGNLPSRDGDNSSFQKVSLVNIFPEFFKIMDIEVTAGRIPQGPQQSESLPRVILNETAVLGFNWTPEEAIGKKVGYSNDAVVVAVVEDIKTVGFQDQLVPMMFIHDHVYFQQTTNDYFLAKVNSTSILESMGHLEETYSNIFPDNDFVFNFSNELFQSQYQKEVDFNRLVMTFSLLSILLSLVGLAGITTYHVILKRKEIGIRKVLGSSINNILILFIKKYFYLILISGSIGLPIAYYISNDWLNNFAYRIDVGFLLLTAPLALMIFLVCLIVSFTSLNAALVNPVNVLKEE